MQPRDGSPTAQASQTYPLHSAQWSAPAGTLKFALREEPPHLSGSSTPVWVSTPTSPVLPSASNARTSHLPPTAKDRGAQQEAPSPAEPPLPPASFALHLEAPYSSDQEVGPRSIRHLLDSNRNMREEFRRPAEALAILSEMGQPAVEDTHMSLLDAAEIFIRAEYNEACIWDRGDSTATSRCYAFTTVVYNSINYIVRGLSLAVSDMLQLEGREMSWHIDPTLRLMYAATGCESKSQLCDAYYILRARVTKALDILRHRAALHCAQEHSEAPSATVSDFGIEWNTCPVRQVLDHYLTRPRTLRELTPEYPMVLQERAEGKPHAGQQFPCEAGRRFRMDIDRSSHTLNLRLILEQAVPAPPQRDLLAGNARPTQQPSGSPARVLSSFHTTCQPPPLRRAQTTLPGPRPPTSYYDTTTHVHKTQLLYTYSAPSAGDLHGGLTPSYGGPVQTRARPTGYGGPPVWTTPPQHYGGPQPQPVYHASTGAKQEPPASYALGAGGGNGGG